MKWIMIPANPSGHADGATTVILFHRWAINTIKWQHFPSDGVTCHYPWQLSEVVSPSHLIHFLWRSCFLHLWLVTNLLLLVGTKAYACICKPVNIYFRWLMLPMMIQLIYCFLCVRNEWKELPYTQKLLYYLQKYEKKTSSSFYL